MSNQKTPTTILLSPDRKFHSFGYAARDFYHDLDPTESKQWLYLEKFKMKLHTTAVRTHSYSIDFFLLVLDLRGMRVQAHTRIEEIIDHKREDMAPSLPLYASCPIMPGYI